MIYKKKKLEKDFGLVFTVIFGFLCIYFFAKNSNYLIYSIIVFSFFFITTLLKPRVLRIPTILWMDLASFISKFTNPIIFSLIFFIILTPLGIILKFLRIDLLKKKINPKITSYWEKKIYYDTSPKNQF